MTPDEQERAFVLAVDELMEKQPSFPEGATPRQANAWFQGIIATIRPKLVPEVMPLAIFGVWTRTLRRAFQFRVPWAEAKEKTDIILRQDRLEKLDQEVKSSGSGSSVSETRPLS
ncbi:hypothetical protein AYO44_09865 [Planctomycetaceae bacterium SCGC AG-212-F19]|nr:hypothetical protein AYO44_09865 [Planctomycetaceae bacterium SCGC AG-212-F19]